MDNTQFNDPNNQIDPLATDYTALNNSTPYQQPIVANVENSATPNQQPANAESGVSILKAFEYIMFGLALTVIASFIFSLNDLGMWGVGLFFLVGAIAIVGSLIKLTIMRARKKDYIGIFLLVIAGLILLIVIPPMMLIAYFMIVTGLGFYEVNS